MAFSCFKTGLQLPGQVSQPQYSETLAHFHLVFIITRCLILGLHACSRGKGTEFRGDRTAAPGRRIDPDLHAVCKKLGDFLIHKVSYHVLFRRNIPYSELKRLGPSSSLNLCFKIHFRPQ
jgi:hypothetical protein